MRPRAGTPSAPSAARSTLSRHLSAPPLPSSSSAASPRPQFSPSLPPKPPAESSPNPYASPQAASYQPQIATSGGPIVNQAVTVEQVFNYSWTIWQANLGLLVGTTLAMLAIIYAVAIPIGIYQGSLQNDSPEAAQWVGIMNQVATNLIQMFLTIGQAEIVLKLARRQQANFSDLFSGGPFFLPIFVSTLIALIVLLPSLLLIVLPFILALMFWPYYYLIVDRKTGIFDSFSVARTITQNNWGTAFILALLGLGLYLLGCCAVFIGLLFSVPLAAQMGAVAYLMMSGQLSRDGELPGQFGVQFAGQPTPGK